MEHTALEELFLKEKPRETARHLGAAPPMTCEGREIIMTACVPGSSKSTGCKLVFITAFIIWQLQFPWWELISRILAAFFRTVRARTQTTMPPALYAALIQMNGRCLKRLNEREMKEPQDVWSEIFIKKIPIKWVTINLYMLVLSTLKVHSVRVR